MKLYVQRAETSGAKTGMGETWLQFDVIRLYRPLCFCLAAIYALSLAALPVDGFVDRNNYLVYAAHSADIIDRYTSAGFLSVVFNEPLWLLLNILCSTLLSPENTIRSFIFFSAIVVAYYTLSKDVRYLPLLILFLLLPQVMKNHVIHLRQGVAVAVFLLGWQSKGAWARCVFFSCACLIHSSFYILSFIYLINLILSQLRLALDLRAVGVSIMAWLIGVGSLWIAGLLGARQGTEYIGQGVTGSGLGFGFWMIVMVIFFLQGKSFSRAHAFPILVLVFYLGTYFLTPVAGRIFESGLILVLIAALGLTGWRKHCYSGLISSYFLLTWYIQLRSPGLAWTATAIG